MLPLVEARLNPRDCNLTIHSQLKLKLIPCRTIHLRVTEQ